jgi:hypothetical protein
MPLKNKQTTEDEEPNLFEKGDSLIAKSPSLRYKTCQEIERICWIDSEDRVTQDFQWSPLFILAWLEYCIKTGRNIDTYDIEKNFSSALRCYRDKEFDDLDTSSHIVQIRIRNEKKHNTAFLNSVLDELERIDSDMLSQQTIQKFRIRFLAASGDYTGLIWYFQTYSENLSKDRVSLELLAHAYIIEWIPEKALEIYNKLQIRYQSLSYLESQISILSALWRDAEAKELHVFGEGIKDQKWTMLKGTSYYREKIQSDDDLKELPANLLDMFSGRKLTRESFLLLQEAERYVLQEIEKIDNEILVCARKRTKVAKFELLFLHVRRLFLLQIGSSVLFIIEPENEEKIGITSSFLESLHTYLFNEWAFGWDVLDLFFQMYDQSFMKQIQKVQLEQIAPDGDKEVAAVEQWRLQTTKMDTQSIPEKIVDIIEYLYCRVESDSEESAEILELMRDFKNKIAGNDPSIDFFEDNIIIEAWALLRSSIIKLQPKEREIYNNLSDYILNGYGPTVRQLIIFFSLNMQVLESLVFDFMENNSRFVLFSLYVMLLWNEDASSGRISEFLEFSCLEIISEEEAYLLCVLLYREKHYSLLPTFIIANPRFLKSARIVELFVMSIAQNSPDDIDEFMNELETACLPQSYDVKTLWEFIESFLKELKSRDAEKTQRLQHADLLYNFTMSDEWAEVEVWNLDDLSLEVIKPEEIPGLYSIYTMLPHAKTREECISRIGYLEKLYQKSHIEKKQIMDDILALACLIRDEQIFMRNKILAEKDGLNMRQWKYTHLFLWNFPDEIAWMKLIATDLFQKPLPSPMLDILEKVRESKGSNSAKKGRDINFQTSLLLCRKEWTLPMLESIDRHFATLFAIIAFHKGTKWYLDIDWVKEVNRYFRDIGYDSLAFDESDDHDAEYSVEFKELLNYITYHLATFRRRLISTIQSEEIDLMDDTIQQSVIMSWINALTTFEWIWYMLPSWDFRTWFHQLLHTYKENAKTILVDTNDSLHEQSSAIAFSGWLPSISAK